LTTALRYYIINKKGGIRMNNISVANETIKITAEGYGKLFDNVCFAIYGNEDGWNYLSFKKKFEA
jgi:hypothetical protein